MAETHQQIVKVWIAPGCIVCDSCESDCPEVFDVQEETCVIRPEAVKAEFTKPLTPSIITAAEGCPVEVIKFETIEVEGPEPWAGKEAEAAEAAADSTGAAGGAKKAAVPIPSGPPDPKWAKLLSTAHASGSRSAGGPPVAARSAKAPVETVASLVGRNAPPDAQSAVMVASGFSRPQPSVADRIRKRGSGVLGTASMTRREFNVALAVAWGAIAATFATAGATLQSYLVPKVTKEPPSTFRAGRLGDFTEPGVYEQFKSQGVWIVHQTNSQLVAISTTCTHLGCIPNWLSADQKFKCPCHGSGFYMNGINFEGPAPRPLERYKISLEGEFLVVDKSKKYRQELGQWEDAASFVAV